MVPARFPTQPKATGSTPKSTPKSKPKPKPKPRSKSKLTATPERKAIMQWTARMGAVTDEALADRLDVTIASARGRLQGLQKAGWLSRKRPLAEQPALYTATRAGLLVAALQGLDPCRVSASNAGHLIVCARVAAALERCYPDHLVLGERELRRDERERGIPLASARLGIAPDGGPLLHRPDLVLWPEEPRYEDGREGGPEGEDGLPVAVEVELTVKAPQRLAEICRAWARCRCVAGVLYLAPPEVERALHRATEQARAGERIAVVSLDALPRSRGAQSRSKAEFDADLKAEFDADLKAEFDADPNAEFDADPKAEFDADPKAEFDADPNGETRTP